VEGRDFCIFLALLERDYLLSIPIHEGALGSEDLGVVTNQQLCWVFCKHFATIIRWTYRQKEEIQMEFHPILMKSFGQEFTPEHEPQSIVQAGEGREFINEDFEDLIEGIFRALPIVVDVPSLTTSTRCLPCTRS